MANEEFRVDDRVRQILEHELRRRDFLRLAGYASSRTPPSASTGPRRSSSSSSFGGLGRIEGPILGTILFFALRQTLADYGSLYLVLVGAVAIVMTVLAPRGLWGLITSRYPMALFGVQRRLALARAEDHPRVAPSAHSE